MIIYVRIGLNATEGKKQPKFECLNCVSVSNEMIQLSYVRETTSLPRSFFKQVLEIYLLTTGSF